MSDRLPYVEHSRLTAKGDATSLLLSNGETEVVQRVADPHEPFQRQVAEWVNVAFGSYIARDLVERRSRFMEEAMELVQSLGATPREMHALVDYVMGRPVGEPPQEVGGTMVTLAALCAANDMNMASLGDAELARIWEPSVTEKIRAKNRNKPDFSPLPGSTATGIRSSKAYVCRLFYSAVVLRLDRWGNFEWLRFVPNPEGSFYVFTRDLSQNNKSMHLKAGLMETEELARDFIDKDRYYEGMEYMIGQGAVT